MISLEEVGALAMEVATDRARLSTIHGTRHWREVARLGMAICDVTPKADRAVVMAFAALHDTQRLSDGTDPEHGRRAAEVVRTLKLGLTPDQVDVLADACAGHADGRTSQQITVGGCWDSDRLCLVRLGIRPDLRGMSSPTVRGDLLKWTALATTIVNRPDVPWSELGTNVDTSQIKEPA